MQRIESKYFLPASSPVLFGSPSITPVRSQTKLQLLVVDGDTSICEACSEAASAMGFVSHVVNSVSAAHLYMQRHVVDILLFDLELPHEDGLPFLEAIRARYPETTVMVMTAFATVAAVVEAMRSGADDYVTKPFAPAELVTKLEAAIHRRNFGAESSPQRKRSRMQQGVANSIGHTPAMEKLQRILSKVAFTNHPVLIIGESGTGKELIARSIHVNGANASKPFIPVDCSSLVPMLLERELFGYVKGAFVGAHSSNNGLLAAAQGGTVYLDEISELPQDLQAKLVRALYQKEARPIGATKPIAVTARILASTNCDLQQMVEQGRFRKDLFDRLNVVSVRIPSLRDRKTDIPVLITNMLERIRRECGFRHIVSDDAVRLLTEYDWPGNVRELEHTIERACALSSGLELHQIDFPLQLADRQTRLERALAEANLGQTKSSQVVSMAKMERQAILGTIQQLNGDRALAAKMLDIGRTTLYRKLKMYEIEDMAEARRLKSQELVA